MNMPYQIAAPAWWGAGLALCAGLGLGLVVALWLSRKSPKDGADPGWQAGPADLDEQMNHCIDQLRDLEEQKSRFEPAVFAQQKAEFEARAVAVMQARRTAAAPRARRAPRLDDISPAMRFLRNSPQLRGFFWGVSLVGVATFLFSLVNSQQVTSPPSPAAAPMAAGASGDAEEMKMLQQALTQKPDDVPHLLKLAHLLLKNQVFEEARKVNEMALRHEPNSVEGQVHAAVLQAAEGHADNARTALETLVKDHDDFAEAWFFRGMLAMQHGDQDVMKDSFRHFVKVAGPGPQRDRIQAMLQAQGG